MYALRRARSVFALLLLAGCVGTPGRPDAVCSTVDAPAPLTTIKRHLVAYHDSGRYEASLAAALEAAEADLPPVEDDRRAVVLDIDETSLSNWTGMLAADFGLGRAFWESWIPRGEATAIVATRRLYRTALARGYAVFFITGRAESQRAVTERNLRDAGYDAWSGLIMRSAAEQRETAAEYKTRARCGLRADGWDVVLNVGDQASDLDGGCADRAVRLPNPFYVIP